jgi:hypothetical protein
MSEPFYTDSNFLNVVYATDIALENYFSSLLFSGDLTRVVYSSNDYAFRKRSDDKKGNLDLPFLNYKLNNFEPGERLRWNLTAYQTGLYIPELTAKIQYAPITLSYQSSFWVHRWDDLIYAYDLLIAEFDNKTLIEPVVQIGSEQLKLSALVKFELEFNPTYTEQDWLDRNKISSISLDFTVDIFRLRTNFDITLVEDVVFEFASNHGYETNSYEETINLVVDHLTEEVE